MNGSATPGAGAPSSTPGGPGTSGVTSQYIALPKTMPNNAQGTRGKRRVTPQVARAVSNATITADVDTRVGREQETELREDDENGNAVHEAREHGQRNVAHDRPEARGRKDDLQQAR